MKKSVICLLILACLLLASCNSVIPADPGTTPAVQTTVGSLEGPTASPMIRRWGFSSYDDFRLFVSTGTKDISLYQAPPTDNMFPPFKMQEKSLLDYEEMFPFLKVDNIIIPYVEIQNDHIYGISFRSKVSEAYFAIIIKYLEDRKDSSVDSIIADKDGEIVRGDYYSQSLENNKSRQRVSYVFACQSCTISYGTFDNKFTGMSISYGQYTITISLSKSTTNPFSTDEDLSSLSCLFQSGEERDKAVLRIQNYLDSVK